MNKKRRSIKTMILIYQIAMVATLISVIGVITYRISVQYMIRDVNRLDNELVNVMNRSFDEMAISFKRFFNYITMDEGIQNTLTAPYPNTESTLFHQSNSLLNKQILDKSIFVDEIHSFYLFDNENMRVAFKRRYIKWEPEIIYPMLKPEDFTLLGNVTMEERGGFLLFKRRILDLHSHHGIGYLVAAFDKARIQQQMDIVNPNGYRNIILLDESQEVIAANGQDIAGAQILLSHLPLNRDSSVIDIDGYGRSVVTISRSNVTGWTIISITSIQRLTESSRIISGATFIIGAVGLAAAAVTITLYTSRLLSPITELTAMVQQLRENNDFSQRFSHQSNNEIGVLTENFNHLLEQVERLITEVYDEEIKRKDAQIMALQAQINPHFLYNTLDCINWLAEFDKMHDIKSVTIAFANLMKASAREQKEVTVQEEINYARDFLTIYSITLQGRLQYEIDIEPNLLSLCIPKLILQPLIENAVVHGIKKQAGMGTLRIKGFVREESVVFQIIDNGIGFPPKYLAEVRRYVRSLSNKERKSCNIGIGVKNVLDRLEIFYGKSFTFLVDSKENLGSILEISIDKASIKHRQEVCDGDI